MDFHIDNSSNIEDSTEITESIEYNTIVISILKRMKYWIYTLFATCTLNNIEDIVQITKASTQRAQFIIVETPRRWKMKKKINYRKKEAELWKRWVVAQSGENIIILTMLPY